MANGEAFSPNKFLKFYVKVVQVCGPATWSWLLAHSPSTVSLPGGSAGCRRQPLTGRALAGCWTGYAVEGNARAQQHCQRKQQTQQDLRRNICSQLCLWDCSPRGMGKPTSQQVLGEILITTYAQHRAKQVLEKIVNRPPRT